MADVSRRSITGMSDTGPLISIFQSESMGLVTSLFGPLQTSARCIEEVKLHGWEDAVHEAGSLIVTLDLTDDERVQAEQVAQRIAAQTSKPSHANDHIGEAEIIVLARRPELIDSVVLIDERAARHVAFEMKLQVSGFAGVLLLAVEQQLIDADDLRTRLLCCQQQGTHYSDRFVHQVYERSKGIRG